MLRGSINKLALRAIGMVIVLSTSVWAAERQFSPRPSFDCRRATMPDEQTICKDERLAELDQAVSIAFAQAGVASGREIAVDALAARHACGSDRICILDNQAQTIELFDDIGAKVPVPPWVGPYRVSLFLIRRESPTVGLPLHVGQCTITKIASISTRFGEELTPPTDELDSSGSAVSFADRGYQVSYSFVPALADSRIGDDVLLCLVSIPKNCPPGDDRGRFYSGTNLRTKESWILPDAQHMCGGA